MPTQQNKSKPLIHSLDLTYRKKPAGFVLRSLEDVERDRPSDAEDHRPHRHNYYTVIWIRKGQGSHDIDFHHYSVAPGMVFFISPEQIHDIDLLPGAEGYVMMFTARFLEQCGIGPEWARQSGLFFSCEHVDPLAIAEEEDRKELEHLLEHIHDEFQEGRSFHEDAISAWLKLFLLNCRRILDRNPREKTTNTTGRSPIMRQFRELLDQHFQVWHKVSDYAGQLHITPNYLNEVVNQETGRSAKDYIVDRIMLEARRYATLDDLSAKEVAYNLGFEDPAHFSKIFKQHNGDSFSGFRETYRKKYN
jgi:AraC family transcriptional regulator, transcriptional activator of pobA